uniref:Uncharacterized protein n=1 Tax=Escherichia coli TaxID=562 RepID=A0A2R4AJA9_ECOLX|nr:hypothetical protein p507-3_00010 [Escherichia coli]AVR62158.1 hypothetical protein p508-2_00092 [Escherichia coli]AVR62371.1 hypothetical protein p300-1_00046 [Escherichia coli]AVR62652.1 hypothetical protein p300-4_00071 [Escherichia coli]AVR64623.1 hypothetical protein p508-1_00092 [Escherichia coli]
MSAWSPEHITLRRTENGNVIAHDSRDDQEFILQNAVPMKSQTSFWKP